MAEPCTNPRPERHRNQILPRPTALMAVIGTVLVTLVAFAWVCLLPFRDDDYTLLRAALRPDAKSVDPLHYLYRPILFAWWRIVASLTGVPLSPFAYHSAALLIHGLNAALLCLVVVRAGGSGAAALAAGLVFGCLPMGGEAVAWVSAGGDLLSTTFLLLALWFALALRRLPLPLYGLGLGTCAALCFLSKESGIVAAPIILAMAATLRAGGRWRALLWSAVPLLVSMGVRRAATGSWSLR
jgi:hypothetical protein